MIALTHPSSTLTACCWLLGSFCAALPIQAQIDLNNNRQSDIWERVYAAHDLDPIGDEDGDGMSNEDEATLGTDPFDPESLLHVEFQMDSDGMVHLSSITPYAKQYDIYYREHLAEGDWTLVDSVVSYAPFSFTEYPEAAHGFYQVRVTDADSDDDGVSDWEELELGFDPLLAHTAYMSDDDLERINAALTARTVLSLHVVDADCYENWPDPAGFVLRRSGGLDPLSVQISYSGSASATDYIGPATTLTIPAGQSDAYLSIIPQEDALTEGSESVTVSLVASSDYDLGSSTSATVTIHDASNRVSDKEAVRLLAQASFGATEADITAVQTLGIEGWIDAQLALPATLLQPATEAIAVIDEADVDVNFYNQTKLVAWWENALHADDQLRQRVAFALSQICVVSDQAGMIDGEAVGMANYYDILVRQAFGNYRDIIEEITYHPVMGIYLSHKGNLPPEPTIGRFPDENYAREIMQLFTIGLWMLNDDGSRVLDGLGEPIPTYDNFEISELARIFTGMNWGTNDPSIYWEYSTYPYESEIDPYTVPMQFWEGSEIDSETGEWLPYRIWVVDHIEEEFYRDHGAKQLIDGSIAPADQLGHEDVTQALDALFAHQNVGPFISYRLIQRLVKSNPSPAYLARVAAIFNDNGNGERGDLGATVKAILMDSEARDFDTTQDPLAGKQREPYLRLVNFARTLDAASEAGPLAIFWNEEEFQQMPMSAPSVFNYYTPSYAPSGSIQELGYVAPEFQITTSVSATTVPNEFYWMARHGILSWYEEPYRPHIDYTTELTMADDPDALIRHLDRLFTYGALTPEQFSIIHDALQRRIDQNRSAEEVVSLAVFLILTSPDYVIQK